MPVTIFSGAFLIRKISETPGYEKLEMNEQPEMRPSLEASSEKIP